VVHKPVPAYGEKKIKIIYVHQEEKRTTSAAIRRYLILAGAYNFLEN